MSGLTRYIGFIFATSILTMIGNCILFGAIYHICDISFVFKIPSIITLLCALILFAARIYTSIVTKILYHFVSIWWSLLIYSVVFSSIYFIFNAFHDMSIQAGLCVVFIPSIILAICGYYNSLSIVTATSDIIIPGLDSSLKIVLISDLHIGPIYGRSHVEKVVKEIEHFDPDLVMIAGDLLDGSMKVDPDVLKPFSNLKASIFFSLGNHDAVFLGIEEVKRSLQYSHIVLLENKQTKWNNVNIIGITYGAGFSYLIEELGQQGIYQNKLNILLYHVPELSVDTLEKYNINLHLAGHTHAGQFVPLCCDGLMTMKYIYGLHSSASLKSHVYTSPGTATAGPRLRMFSRSTVTLLNVHP